MTAPALVYAGIAWGPPGRGQPLFSGLDLALEPGSMAVLSSGLGGGKSSALRLAVGLERPWAGSVTVCGGQPEAMRHRIGYVGGEGGLLANLSLYDNLVLPLRWRRDPPADEVAQRARAALALFGVDGLPAVAPAYAPTNLRRLVALARAMILDPEVLVLDEPAAEFDPRSADELWEHLADLARARGLAILAGTTLPPHLPGVEVIPLDGAEAPGTRRFSSGQRRSVQLPALRPARPHPDLPIPGPP